MVNYYTINNNLNRYTYNDRSGTKEDNTFDGCRPSNVCLNDVGLQTQTFFGQNTKQLVSEFIHARYEIWTRFPAGGGHPYAERAYWWMKGIDREEAQRLGLSDMVQSVLSLLQKVDNITTFK